MVEKKYNYLYKITNLLNNKFYIGIHSTDDLDDNYYGSGLLINKAIDKYGIENFTKEILYFVSTREDLLDLERFIVDNTFLERPDTYNVQLGGSRWNAKDIYEKISNSLKGRPSQLKGKAKTEEHKRKISNSLKGRHISEEAKQKISETTLGVKKNYSAWNKGKKTTPLTEETKEKISKANKGKTPWNKGKTGIYSEETKRKLSEAKRGKTTWIKGKHHTVETKQKISEKVRQYNLEHKN